MTIAEKILCEYNGEESLTFIKDLINKYPHKTDEEEVEELSLFGDLYRYIFADGSDVELEITSDTATRYYTLTFNFEGKSKKFYWQY